MTDQPTVLRWSRAVAVRPVSALVKSDDLATYSLEQLATSANTEHRAVEGSVQSALAHAIRCGEILLETHGRVARGDWVQWTQTNLEIERSTVYMYIRLATHQEHLVGVPSVAKARRKLTELGVPNVAINGGSGNVNGGQNRKLLDKDDIRRMREDGLSWVQIAGDLGVSYHTARSQLDRAYAKDRLVKGRESKARARKAEALLTRDQAVKAAGGTPAVAYGLLRRAAQKLDGAIIEASDREARAALKAALAAVHQAEDDVVRALRIDRTTVRNQP